jgi:hypothetical protein
MREVKLALLGVLIATNAAADECAKIEVPAKLEHRSSHDAKIPDIVDYGEPQLDGFYGKLAQVARTKQGTLRIGIYGDSNWTNDRTAGEIRRRLQLAYGDAGHGFVAFGIPWGWYHHQNLQHGTTGKWDVWNIATMEVRDKLYGFAGITAESSQPGATAWVETAKAGEPVGTSVSVIEVWYLARPKGGRFEVVVDKESKEVVDTASASPEMKVLTYKVPDGPHRLTVKVTKGSVRLFGAVFERDKPGVIVDGIGINALSAATMTRMDLANQSAGLVRRNYDLLIDATGTNMWAAQAHPRLIVKHTLQWRAALPKSSILLWSAPDFISEGTTSSTPRMKQNARERIQGSKDAKVAFWDQYEMLGGYGSMPKWHKDRWDTPDGVHMGPPLSAYIGERFVYTVLADLAKRVDKAPRLGCR